jgi:hypothetical protein
MIELQTTTNWISPFLFLQIFGLLLGVFVACFAEKVFWWWFDLLHAMGSAVATRIKTAPGSWVPKLPSPLMVRTEMKLLRVAGIVLAAASGLSIFAVIILS